MERCCFIHRSSHRRKVLLHRHQRKQPYQRPIRLPCRLMRRCPASPSSSSSPSFLKFLKRCSKAQTIESFEATEAERAAAQGPIWKQFNLFFAFLAQFCYVGAQVTIASFFLNYATDNAPIRHLDASNMLSYALITFTVGRFVSLRARDRLPG